ncbi:MAG: carboxypeptidase regulatory-like domain-containing protein [Planctomycetes bacterium]|nr:carboxypeptidase regulatory-like domain-containing protein [Planctomycetota bacterium]
MASRPALRLLLALVAGTAAMTAQAPPLVVLLRDPSGQPVAGAEGTLRCGPEHELVALAGLADAAVAATGRSDAQGLLRFAVDGPPRAGGGLVTTAAGLGALLPRLRPGAAQRIVLQPLAAVTTRTGSDEFVLLARAHTLEHGAVTLPRMRGTRVLLPAGSYEVWAGNEDGWTWQRLDLASGQRTTLEFTGPAQRLQSRGGARIHPTGWPQLTLCEPGGVCVLRGAALAAPLTAVDLAAGALVADRTLPMPPRATPIDWPDAPASDAEAIEFRLGTAAATLFSVRRAASGSWQLLGGGRAAADGRVRLPAPGDGDTWLLLVADGHAPLGRPWSTIPVGSELTLARGVPLLVQARAPNGDPAVDLLVEYVPDGADAATVRARSDGRGLARLGLATAPGTLFVSDPRFANLEVALDQVPLEPLAIALEAGSRVHGRARLDGGDPAVGAVITLRDPSGRLRPAERAVAADDDGRFEFAGLPDDRGLVLFASMPRGGHTWSGRRTQFAAGDDPVDVVLRDEDPRLEPPK